MKTLKIFFIFKIKLSFYSVIPFNNNMLCTVGTLKTSRSKLKKLYARFVES